MFLTIKLFTNAKMNLKKIELTIRIKVDLSLNNLQKLMCLKTQPTNQFIDLFIKSMVSTSNALICFS